MEDIKIIQQTTTERNQEIIDLFHKIEPFLKEDMSLTAAIMKVKNINYRGFTSRAWYKELREYAKEQGYLTRR